MWKKIVKLRSLAKHFHKKDVGNGRHTSFWYENWSELGVLSDLLGDRGTIDLGIRRCAMVEEVLQCPRRRRNHRSC